MPFWVAMSIVGLLCFVFWVDETWERARKSDIPAQAAPTSFELHPSPEFQCPMLCEVNVGLGPIAPLTPASQASCVAACQAALHNMPDMDFLKTYSRCNSPCFWRIARMHPSDEQAARDACLSDCVIALSKREHFSRDVPSAGSAEPAQPAPSGSIATSSSAQASSSAASPVPPVHR